MVMRLCVLLLAATSLLATSEASLDVVRDTSQSKSSLSSPVHLVDVIRGVDNGNRFLRIRENVDDDEDTEDKNLKGEERTLPKLDRVVSDLSADATKGAVKLTRTNSLLPATLDEEVAALKKFYQSIKAQYTTVFKDFAEVKNLNPLQAADEWKIWHKLKTKSMDELASDPFYLFWMKYKQYWDKHHGTAYMN